MRSVMWVAGRDIIFCFFAVFSFSYLMSAPKKAMVVSSLIAAVGYLAFDLLSQWGTAELLVYFIGTVVISSGGEWMAKIIKVPSVLLVYPAVIPMVPGIGLYQTMLYLIQNEYESFSRTGTQTILIAITMASGIAITRLFARISFEKRSREA